MQRLDNVSLKSKLFNNNSWVLKILIGLVLGILWIGFSQFIVVKADTGVPTGGNASSVDSKTTTNGELDPNTIYCEVIQTDKSGTKIGEDVNFTLPANTPSVENLDFGTLLKGVSANRPLIASSLSLNHADATYVTFSDPDPDKDMWVIYGLLMNRDNSIGGFNNGPSFVKGFLIDLQTNDIFTKCGGQKITFHLFYKEQYNPMQFKVTQADAKGTPMGGDTNFNLEVGSSIDDANSKLSESLKNVSDKPVALSDTDKVNSYYDVLDTAGKLHRFL